MNKLIRTSLLAFAPALLSAWMVGFYFRDGIAELIWFYFIPAPAVVFLVTAWLLLFRRSAGRLLTFSVVMLAVLPLAKILIADFRYNRTVTVPEHALKVVHWNIARIPFGIEAVKKVLEADTPDICLISEPGDTAKVARAGAEIGLTNQFYSSVMTLMSRYPLTQPEPFQFAGVRGWRCRVNTSEASFDVVGVDVVSKPSLNRGPPLEEVAEWTDARDSKIPMLVMGDFNTARDSLAFNPFRERFIHAYESAGSGWPYSWPFPFPAYQLDHAWYTPETMNVFNYELHSSVVSDHRRQVFYILPLTVRRVVQE